MITANSFTRINNDINGNPRFVIHFLGLNTQSELNSSTSASKYELALKRSRKLGGKKFHNKQYGGGIVFQSYAGCLESLANSINELVAE
jgi:hypothetical protein